MLSPSVSKLITDLAASERIPEDVLIREALRSLLREKKRAIQNDRLDILKRYQVSSGEGLDDKIREGMLPESRAWEDRIALDNLQEALSNADSALASL